MRAGTADAALDASPCDLRDEGRRANERRLDAGGIDPALEAIGRVGDESEPSRRGTNAARREDRALEEQIARLAMDGGARTAHHAGERYRTLAVANDEVGRFESPALTVERVDGALVPRTRDEDLRPHQQIGIEGVQWLPALPKQIVRDVDHVVDRSQPARAQSRGEPGRRRPDANATDLDTGVERADVGRVNANRHASRARRRRRRAMKLRREGQIADRGDLPCDAAHTQAVPAIRRHADLENRVVDAEQTSRVLAGGDARVEDDDPGLIFAETDLGG